MLKVIAEIESLALDGITRVEKTAVLRPRSKTNKVIVAYFYELFNINWWVLNHFHIEMSFKSLSHRAQYTAMDDWRCSPT